MSDRVGTGFTVGLRAYTKDPGLRETQLDRTETNRRSCLYRKDLRRIDQTSSFQELREDKRARAIVRELPNKSSHALKGNQKYISPALNQISNLLFA